MRLQINQDDAAAERRPFFVLEQLDQRCSLAHAVDSVLTRYRTDWSSQGFVHLPGFASADRCARLRELCDHTLAIWRQQNSSQVIDTTNMSYLMDERYWENASTDHLEFLETIAEPAMISLLEGIAQTTVGFRNTQYFVDPPTMSWDGPWHRDTQFDAWDDDAERIAMSAFVGAHFRIALVRDDNLELVPGSHERFDTPDEYAVRKNDEETRRTSSRMPGSERIFLQPGDALLFHAWMIHRGRYRARVPRRTLDLVLGWGDALPEATRAPLPRNVLQGLSSRARSFLGLA